LEREPSRLAAGGNAKDFENQVRLSLFKRAADGDRPRSGQTIPLPERAALIVRALGRVQFMRSEPVFAQRLRGAVCGLFGNLDCSRWHASCVMTLNPAAAFVAAAESHQQTTINHDRRIQ